MTDAIKPDPMTQNEKKLIKQLSARTVQSRADLLLRAKNNRLGVSARVLAVLDWDALDELYTILGRAMDELMAQLEDRQHGAVGALQARLDKLPASTLTTGVDVAYDEEEWNEACEHTLQASDLISDMFLALNPPGVSNKPAARKLGR